MVIIMGLVSIRAHVKRREREMLIENENEASNCSHLKPANKPPQG